MPLPFIPPAQLEETARRFLTEQHPSGALPVPIEDIVEFNLGMNVIPVANLYREFGVEGWLSNDLSTIYVDETQVTDYATRYRFTLAHEVAHCLLHSDMYRSGKFCTVEEWIAWLEGLDEKLIDDLEWQGRNLAGRILVPLDALVREASAVLEEYKDKIPPDIDRQSLWQYVSIPLSRTFCVHDTVVFYRLSGDRVGDRLIPSEETR